MKKIWLMVIVCGLLTGLLAGCAIVDTSTMPTGPTVHMNGADFVQHSITIQKGQSLTLIDDASAEHIITNGSWANGVAKPKQEAGAPKVYQTIHGNDSATIGPWNTPWNLSFILHHSPEYEPDGDCQIVLLGRGMRFEHYHRTGGDAIPA